MNRVRNISVRLWWVLPIIVASVNILVRHSWLDFDPLGRPDVQSYFHAWDKIRECGIDCFRTPVYPIFAGAIFELFGDSTEHATRFIITLQNIGYLLSVFGLLFICRRGLRLPKWASLIATLPYCMVGLFPMYSSFILTDAPGTYLLVLTAAVAVWNLRHPPTYKSILLGTLLTLLIFLRPVLLYAVIAVFLTILYLIFKDKRLVSGIRNMLLILLIPCGSLVCYATAFRNTAGYFGISSVNDLNQTLIDLKYTTDADSAAFPFHYSMLQLARNADMYPLSKWNLYHELASDNTRALHQEVEDFANRRSNHLLLSHIDTIRDNLKERMFGGKVPMYVFFFIPVGYFFFMAAMRRRREVWPRLLLWLLVMGNVGVVLVGAPNEYPRLLMPSFPIVMLMIGDVVSGGGGLLRRGSRGNGG